jgi:hypothetical protein
VLEVVAGATGAAELAELAIGVLVAMVGVTVGWAS